MKSAFQEIISKKKVPDSIIIKDNCIEKRIKKTGSLEDLIPIYKEIAITMNTLHPNLLKFQEIILEQEKNFGAIKRLVLVFKKTGHTLSNFRCLISKNVPNIMLTTIMFQIFKALAHLHINGFAHGDLHLNNILVDLKTFMIKIFDFGCIKRIRDKSDSVASTERYFRAPENIFGSLDSTTKKKYDQNNNQFTYNSNDKSQFKADIFSAGQIFFFLVTGRYFYKKNKYLKSIFKRIRKIGSDDENKFQDIVNNYESFEEIDAINPSLLNLEGKELLKMTLKYYPEQRPTAIDVLQNSFFKSLNHGVIQRISQYSNIDFKFNPNEETFASLVEKIKHFSFSLKNQQKILYFP